MYGEAAFKSPTKSPQEKRRRRRHDLGAANIVIATGSAPIDVKAWPRDGETIINSDDAVGVKRIPKNMLVIGGGVIGLEFATVYHAHGRQSARRSRRCRRFLPERTSEISKTLGRILKKQGVEIMLDTKVGETRERAAVPSRPRSTAKAPNGKDETRDFDMVLVAVGRRTRHRQPEPAAAGLDRRRQRLHLRSISRCARRSPNIFAIGDVTGQPLLAHRAMKQGVVAAEVICGDKSAAFDPVAIPNCVYTDPEVATVGLSEEEAKAKGLRGAHRKVSARRQRPRSHDERKRRPHQARRGRQERTCCSGCTSLRRKPNRYRRRRHRT